MNTNRLATKLQLLYEKKRTTPRSTYKSAKKFDACWPRVAKVVTDLNADPVLFIEAQFLIPGGNLDRGFPFPSQLYGDAAIQKYRAVAAWDSTPFEASFNNQAKYVRDLQATFPERTIDEILLDPRSPIKNFTRVILCSPEAYEGAFKRYGEDAKKELESDTGLNEFIKNNYGSRYKRIFPERLPTWIGGEHSEDPGPPATSARRKNYPKRRKQSDT